MGLVTLDWSLGTVVPLQRIERVLQAMDTNVGPSAGSKTTGSLEMGVLDMLPVALAGRRTDHGARANTAEDAVSFSTYWLLGGCADTGLLVRRFCLRCM